MSAEGSGSHRIVINAATESFVDPDGVCLVGSQLTPRRRHQVTTRQPGPRTDLVARSAPFLPAGSQIRQVFICQSAPHFWYFLLTYLVGVTMPWIRYRCVAISDDSIYVLESSKLSGGAKPRHLLGTMPRHTRLGPVSGRWAQLIILGQRHWVHRRFHEQIAATDQDAGFTSATS